MYEVCHQCKSSGYVKVFNKQHSSIAICNCNWGRIVAHPDLPVLNKKITEEFEVVPVPLAWFLPDNEKESVPRGELKPSLTNKINDWAMRLKEAQEFWTKFGNLFEDRRGSWTERY